MYCLKHEVGQHGPLDRLLDLGVGVVYELAYLLAVGLLPVGQPANVVVHPEPAFIITSSRSEAGSATSSPPVALPDSAGSPRRHST